MAAPNHPSTDQHQHPNERTPLVQSSSLSQTNNLRKPASLSAESNYEDNEITRNGGGSGVSKINADYIVSWIRRKSALDQYDKDGNENDKGNHRHYSRSIDDESSNTGTTWGQTIIHLVKGYIGCGILSLPWALSQLGIPLGLLAIGFMAIWTSYNCWTVTRLKQYIEATTNHTAIDIDESDDSDSDENNDTSNISSQRSVASNATTTTYPDVGEWAYGRNFQKYVAICICAQQLAICTVFVGFVGENLWAACQYWELELPNWAGTKQGITTLCLPLFVGLPSALPTIRSMSPCMALGFLLMLSGFSMIGYIGVLQWNFRPSWESLRSLKIDRNLPMALCGILYSFEGICIILPVESAMKHPVRDFKSAFCVSIVIITFFLWSMAGLCVITFGEVTNGSITAFLLETYQDPNISQYAILANLLVSLSIIVSYPLMLYPAVELVAPMVFDWSEARRKQRRKQQSAANNKESNENDEDSLGFSVPNSTNNIDNDGEGFAPMAGIPEHAVASMRSLPSLEEKNAESKDTFTLSSEETKLSEQNMTPDAETIKTGDATDGGGMSESTSLISRLSSNLSYERSIVDSIDCNSDNEEDIDEDGMSSPARSRKSHHRQDSAFDWVLPGDSPLLRALLVLATYLVAILVPNVQSLVSLVGAVTGSSTALLIPPILELAYIRHMEAKQHIARKSSMLLLGDWEGGPSKASKRLLFGNSPKIHHRYSSLGKQKPHSYLWDKVLSWFLLILGTVFALIGSYFSVVDILESYQ